jgi:hypothetical protein
VVVAVLHSLHNFTVLAVQVAVVVVVTIHQKFFQLQEQQTRVVVAVVLLLPWVVRLVVQVS